MFFICKVDENLSHDMTPDDTRTSHITSDVTSHDMQHHMHEDTQQMLMDLNEKEELYGYCMNIIMDMVNKIGQNESQLINERRQFFQKMSICQKNAIFATKNSRKRKKKVCDNSDNILGQIEAKKSFWKSAGFVQTKYVPKDDLKVSNPDSSQGPMRPQDN